MHYLIGDVQGCAHALDRLLAEIAFSPSRDRLHVLGDLVNRGPDSLNVLRRLHLLAVAAGIRPEHRSDTLRGILDAPDRERWIDWVRRRPLADTAHGWLLVHAGVVPQWDADQTLALAREVETMLRGPDLEGFLRVMYGNEPLRWSDDLHGADRWRFVINVLTRIRFCTDDGTLEFGTKEGAAGAPPGHRPWFEVPGRRTAGQPIATGHWSTLGLVSRPDLLSIDTGCVWGGRITAVRVDGGRREVIQIPCTPV
jgi:bis(5'-nucleosyl)-tetraphosphatase (symmetrical)